MRGEKREKWDEKEGFNLSFLIVCLMFLFAPDGMEFRLLTAKDKGKRKTKKEREINTQT